MSSCIHSMLVVSTSALSGGDGDSYFLQEKAVSAVHSSPEGHAARTRDCCTDRQDQRCDE